ncbi:ABC transporter ATP-binding protein [Streptomyces murinus]|uniref:ATP-binding cassette subfamily B protein n=1 Tax=Streptomyces murinus TaxID=33900 RepID=A0A7W3NST3_STRMR|nr:ABC transporter ATP-binding protein [Streptomyces murinus]MBA9056109.1 ATP-binding cassette subfamily B protein [Streptomyces murinus]UWW90619.1 ATP-binding cassette domain-containing protein [Streptomyces murinus]
MPTTRATTQDRSAVRSLLRLWPYVRPVRARLLTAALIAVVASCTGLVIPLVLKWMVDGPVADRDPAGVWLGALYLLLLGIAEAVLFGIRRWLVARPLSRVEAGMRADLYRHLQRLPVAFHDRWASGQLLSRGTTDLMLLRMFLAFPLTFLLVNGVTILVGVAIMLAQDWLLGLVVLVPAVPVLWTCVVFEGRYARVARRAQDQVGDLTTLVEESVLGIRVVKGFGRHRSQARAFDALCADLRGTELHKARLLATIWGVIVTLPELAIGAALVLGVIQVADGDLSAGTLVAFLSTALALRWPVESIGFLLAMSQEAATATERYFEAMDEAPEGGPAGEPADSPHDSAPEPTEDGPRESAPGPAASEPVGKRPLESAGIRPRDPASEPAAAGLAAAEPAGDAPRQSASASAPAPAPESASAVLQDAVLQDAGLRFENVRFRYPDAAPDSPPLLQRVDLHIRPGESMALVGATGSGKTTLTALVPRLHEVTSGRITLNGVDITAMPREELREKVAVAFEEPTLFSTTVGENVLMGAPDGTGADDLDRALAIARAEFAHALPEGTGTRVGEQGLSLSGGQRQRLALARAVVGRPEFLVLDDPLSALDVHTEAAVEAALRRVLADTTALIVAHRPSTVLLADRVALLSDGRIAAVGTHQELLRGNAEYAHLMSGEEDPR